MKCPFCAKDQDKVIDSRGAGEGAVIRRRRECLGCKRRFTTYERVEEILPLVVKKDGRREQYDRQKIVAGLQKACEKRPISAEQIEAVVDGIERRLQELGEKEVPATLIGESVMRALHQLDDVAYVRFASVYRSFRDIGEFMAELKDLMDERRSTRPGASRQDLAHDERAAGIAGRSRRPGKRR